MLQIFDYAFFRAFSFYSKNENESMASTSASLIVSLYQLLMIGNLIFLMSLVFEFKWPGHKPFIPVAVALMAVNWFRYERGDQLNKLMNRWENETDFSKRIKGWIMILVLPVSFQFLGVMACLSSVIRLKQSLGCAE